MPDGNVPSARIPTPSDDQPRSSPTPDEARAPSSGEPSTGVPTPSSSKANAARVSNSVPRANTTRRTAATAKPGAGTPAAPAPANRLTRLDTLRKQLVDARSSPLPLTELLQAYDKELHSIKLETEKNGGRSPLSYKEQEELRRVEEERETLASTREDDPRARARALAEHLKRISASNTSANVTAALDARREQKEQPTTATQPIPTAHDLEMLRSELTMLKNEAWQNDLTRELNRAQGATIDDLEKALEQAEKAVKATSLSPVSSVQPPPSESAVPAPETSATSSPEASPTSQETPSVDSERTSNDASSVTPDTLPGTEEPANDNAVEQATAGSGAAAVAAGVPTIQETREALREEEREPTAATNAENLPLTQDEETELAELTHRFHTLSTALTNQRETLHRSADALQREVEELQAAALNDRQHTELRRLVKALETHSESLTWLADTAKKDYEEFDDRFSAFSETTPDDRRAALRERRAIVAAFEKQIVDGFLPYSNEAAVDTQKLLTQQRSVLEQALERARAQKDAALVDRLEEVAFRKLTNRSEQANERHRTSIDELRTSFTSATTTSADEQTEATITDARAELRAKYTARLHEQEVLKLYQDRIRERSWSYLQTREPSQFQRLQSMQAQLKIEIDPSTTLTQQELETIHLQAIQDVRLQFPEVTDALLSTILLHQAQAQLASAAALQAGVSAGALQTAVEGAAAAGAAIGMAAVAASVTGAGLLTAFAQQREATEQLAQELANEEQQIIQRATTVKTAATAPAQGAPLVHEGSPRGETLRQAQRESTGKRRGLQAKLHVHLKQLQAWNSGLAARATGAGSSLSPESLGILAVVSPKTFRIATAPQTATNRNDQLEFDDTTRRMQQTRDRLSRQQTDTAQDTLSPEQREHAKAAHLQSLKARAKTTLPSINQTSSRSADASNAASEASEQAPLLALSPAPKTRQEAFARRQTLMNRERDQFLGVGSTGSGYEATFGLATSPSASETVEDLSEFAEEDEGDDVIDVEERDLMDQQAWQAELLRRQQLAAQQREQEEAQNQESLVNGQNAQRLQQAAKLLRGAGTTTVGAAIAAVLVVVLIIWLNIRLFFPDPESSWRKPLGAFGKIGTIGLDFLMFTLSVLQFLLLIGIMLVPLVMLLLPGAIIAGTLLQAIGH